MSEPNHRIEDLEDQLQSVKTNSQVRVQTLNQQIASITDELQRHKKLLKEKNQKLAELERNLETVISDLSRKDELIAVMNDTTDVLESDRDKAQLQSELCTKDLSSCHEDQMHWLQRYEETYAKLKEARETKPCAQYNNRLAQDSARSRIKAKMYENEANESKLELETLTNALNEARERYEIANASTKTCRDEVNKLQVQVKDCKSRLRQAEQDETTTFGSINAVNRKRVTNLGTGFLSS